MGNSPLPSVRAKNMAVYKWDKYITIEPIMDFDIDIMVQLIMDCNAKQVNIGADSGENNLPEPSKEKVLELISELEKFTIVHQKSNLKRILK
jgi:hypothetical protein